MILHLLVMATSLACDIVCTQDCATSSCVELCNCSGAQIGLIPGFAFQTTDQLYHFQDLHESELGHILENTPCDLWEVGRCRSSLSEEALLGCILQAGCGQFLSKKSLLMGSLDKTDCIVQCTKYCQKESPDHLDACLSACLSAQCKNNDVAN